MFTETKRSRNNNSNKIVWSAKIPKSGTNTGPIWNQSKPRVNICTRARERYFIFPTTDEIRKGIDYYRDVIYKDLSVFIKEIAGTSQHSTRKQKAIQFLGNRGNKIYVDYTCFIMDEQGLSYAKSTMTPISNVDQDRIAIILHQHGQLEKYHRGYTSHSKTVFIPIGVLNYQRGGRDDNHAISAFKNGNVLFCFNPWGDHAIDHNEHIPDKSVFKMLANTYKCDTIIRYTGTYVQRKDKHGTCVAWNMMFGNLMYHTKILDILYATHTLAECNTEQKFNTLVETLFSTPTFYVRKFDSNGTIGKKFNLSTQKNNNVIGKFNGLGTNHGTRRVINQDSYSNMKDVYDSLRFQKHKRSVTELPMYYTEPDILRNSVNIDMTNHRDVRRARRPKLNILDKLLRKLNKMKIK